MNIKDLKGLYRVCEALDKFMSSEYDHRLEFQTLDDLKDMGVCYTTYEDDDGIEHEIQLIINLFEKTLTVYNDSKATFSEGFKDYKELYNDIQSWTFDSLYFYGVQHA